MGGWCAGHSVKAAKAAKKAAKAAKAQAAFISLRRHLVLRKP
jgi:hypothetical protein